MTTRILELPGMQVEFVDIDRGQVTLEFSTANIIKSMDDAVDKTLWRQAGCLKISEAELSGELPQFPAHIEHADINDNTYTQRDMIQIPLHSSGRVGCEIQFQGHAETVIISGEEIRLLLYSDPKYVRHLSANSEA